MELTREVLSFMAGVDNLCYNLNNLKTRDLFAMSALNGLIATDSNTPEVIADKAYAIADAMIEKRKEKK